MHHTEVAVVVAVLEDIPVEGMVAVAWAQRAELAALAGHTESQGSCLSLYLCFTLL